MLRALRHRAALAAAAVLLSLPAFAENGGSQADLARMRELSQDLAQSYLRLWSTSKRGALADVGELYGDRVAFYGRFYSKRELAAEKQRFVRRWPIRRYAIRPGTMRANCNAVLRVCQVHSIIDWAVESPGRRKASRGSSRFDLGIDFGDGRPVVRGENGRVIARR